jgi:hypothetical protein
MVFHNQEIDISKNIISLEKQVANWGYPRHAIHTGPLIRRESVYKNDLRENRKALFNALYHFTRMVDINYRGKGLGTLMNRILNEVGFGIGLRLFETVNKDNIASYRSAMSASNVKVIEEMEDGDLYLEILKD